MSIEEVHESFNKYWNGIKYVFKNFKKHNDIENNSLKPFFTAGENAIVSRPILFGKDYYRIGYQFGEMRMFDSNNIVIRYPFPGITNENSEIFFKDLIKDSVKTTDDLVDMVIFYTQVFDGVTNNKIG